MTTYIEHIGDEPAGFDQGTWDSIKKIRDDFKLGNRQVVAFTAETHIISENISYDIFFGGLAGDSGSTQDAKAAQKDYTITDIYWMASDDQPLKLSDVNDPKKVITEYQGLHADYNELVAAMTSDSSQTRYEYLDSLLDGAMSVTGGKFDDAFIEVGTGGTATVDSGAGDDTVWIWQKKNVVFDGGKGSDTIDFGYQAGFDLATSDTGATVDLSKGTAVNPFGGTIKFKNVENIVGWAGASNTLTGDNHANALTGGNYGDTLKGMGGNDTITIEPYFGTGTETQLADGGKGKDTLIFSSFTGVANTLDLTDPANDSGAFAGSVVKNFETYRALGDSDGFFFHGTDAAEKVYASANGFMADGVTATSDSLYGGGGDDLLDGGNGVDTLVGGTGNDTYHVDNIGDVVVEKHGEGSDTVIADLFTQSTYILPDNVENLTLVAQGSAKGNDLGNTINGSTADNAIDGQGGNDLIYGGSGVDTLTGGDGADHFIYRNAHDSWVTPTNINAYDTITDFSHADKDKIDLSAIDAAEGAKGDQKFDFIGDGKFDGHAGELRVYVKGSETIVEADTNGDKVADLTIHLDHAPKLVEGDFVL